MNYKQLANNLLDMILEIDGLKETVANLVGLDYSTDELLLLGFDIETINNAKELLEQETR